MKTNRLNRQLIVLSFVAGCAHADNKTAPTARPNTPAATVSDKTPEKATAMKTDKFASVTTDVDYKTSQSSGNAQVVFKKIGESIDVYKTDGERVSLLLKSVEANKVEFVATVWDSNKPSFVPRKSTLVSQNDLGAQAHEKSPKGELIYSIKVKPHVDPVK